MMQSMIFELFKIITIFYMVFFLSLLLLGGIKKIRVSKTYYVLAFVFLLCASFWAYGLTPGNGLDLYRLHESVDWVRQNSTGVIDAVLNPNEKYIGLTGVNFLFYLVSCTNSNRWLQTVSVFVTGAIIFYVVINFIRSKDYNSRQLLIALVLTFMGMPVQYILSGVRNAMAVALALLSSYWIFYKRSKHPIVAVVVYFLGATIHPIVFLLIPVIALAFCKKQYLFRALALLGLPIAFSLAPLLSYVPIKIVQYISVRLLYYQNISYAYDRPEMIANLAVFSVVGLSWCFCIKNRYIAEPSHNEKIYLNVYYLMGCLMIGCSVHRDFTLRIGYMMGILAIPIVLKLLSRMRKEKENPFQQKLLITGIYLSIFVCAIKVFYDSAYGLSFYSFY